jgi:hypothetical protein
MAMPARRRGAQQRAGLSWSDDCNTVRLAPDANGAEENFVNMKSLASRASVFLPSLERQSIFFGLMKWTQPTLVP